MNTNMQIEINKLSEEIALIIYPKKWQLIDEKKGFRIDNNAGSRSCAVKIIRRFLTVMRDESVVTAVMKAFYRREHGQEPEDSDTARLTAMMGTALMAYELALKDNKQSD